MCAPGTCCVCVIGTRSSSQCGELGHRPKKENRHECDQHTLRDGGEPRHKTGQDDGDRDEHPDGWELHSGDEQERSHITGDVVGGDAVAETRHDAGGQDRNRWPSWDLRPSKWGPAALLGRPRSAGTIAYTQEGV